MRSAGRFRRVHAYAAVWSVATSIALVVRYTTFAETSSDDRWVLTCTYIFATWPLLVAGHIVEQRRLAVAAGLRGRGCLGVLRGWVKTASIEVAASDDDLSSTEAGRRALRDYVAFRRLGTFAFTAYLLIIPLLLF